MYDFLGESEGAVAGIRSMLDVSAPLSVRDSALIELVNYSRHVRISELPARSVEKVLFQIGSLSMDVAKQSEQAELIGPHVRAVIAYLCGAADNDCSNVADRILQDDAFLTEEDFARIRVVARLAEGG